MTAQNWEQLSEELTKALGLKHPPIAIIFSQDELEDVPFYEGEMPSPSADGRTGRVAAGCVFWIKSTDSTFMTIPQDHYNCSIGSVTHGLKTLENVMEQEDVKSILECEWVTAEEAMQLPVIQERPNYITYGPLAETSILPDVLLLRLTAFQSMLMRDAVSNMPIVGKPQCHIIPIANEQNQVVMSTGCMLSRIRTGMSPNEMTCAIPGNRIEEVIEKLKAGREANSAVGAYANHDMRRFAEE